jgi:hypothetical protein
MIRSVLGLENETVLHTNPVEMASDIGSLTCGKDLLVWDQVFVQAVHKRAN